VTSGAIRSADARRDLFTAEPHFTPPVIRHP
jgi:hypothetical protein